MKQPKHVWWGMSNKGYWKRFWRKWSIRKEKEIALKDYKGEKEQEDNDWIGFV